MKRNVFGALMTLIVAGTLASTAAYAQNNQTMLAANVPFAFSIDSKAMPAGAYEVAKVGDRATLIETKDHRSQVIGIYQYAESNKSAETKLVFDKVGDHYFLRQIWSSNSGQGLQLPTSKLEKEEMASNRANGSGEPETVIVALR
jgi:hypothetical protein